MESIQTTRALSFKPNTLSFVREQVNINSPTRINEAIDLLIQWIQKQNHFIKKDFSREYLERCVIISKGSVERAKRKMEKSYTFRTLMPELLQFSNPRDLMKEYEGSIINVVLPQLTDGHDRVYVMRNCGQKFTSFTNYYKFLLMMCEYFQAKDYNNGVIGVFDYIDANVLEIVKTINIVEARQLITIVTEGFSLRLKGVHFMTSSKAIDTLVSLLKQALSEKLAKRIHVHRDLTSLKEHFPLEILPIEYGGKEKSMYKLQADHFIEATVVTAKGSIEGAKKQIDSACTMRTMLPHFFGVTDFTKDFANVFDIGSAIVMPKLTEEHHRIFVLKSKGPITSSAQLLNFYRFGICLGEYMKAHDYVASYQCIFDIRLANVSDVIKNLNPMDLRQIITIIVECYGLRIKGLHIVSNSKVVDTLIAILKTLLKPKMIQRLQHHKDCDTLIQLFGKEYLPEDLGGTEPSVKDLRDAWAEVLHAPEFTEYIRDMDNAKTDESFRPKCKFNEEYAGMPGTFRVLSVD
ncbi:uncharacterized protein LOC125057115 isoform X2 [Pieris napi]|uniref:uncharacterized protein LOC125057115 isoform X2 n=1 Tax=Pieris napi TaxID=78633 RepID=UPI001FBA2988|nr:uncharacterized protein LOC125057115 isoform X2 [Pieris napi]